MEVSYKKLWKLLIDKDMKKRDLEEAADIGRSTMAKMTKGEHVSLDVLLRVCDVLRLFQITRIEVSGAYNEGY